MIKILLLATFYAPALPIALVFTVAGLFFFYWAEKYIFLRRAALPSPMQNEIVDEMVEYSEWAGFTFAIGNLLYVFTLKDENGDFAFSYTSYILCYITLALSTANIFLPMDYVNKVLFPIADPVTESDTYLQAKDKDPVLFKKDYEYCKCVSILEKRSRSMKAVKAALAFKTPPKVARLSTRSTDSHIITSPEGTENKGLGSPLGSATPMKAFNQAIEELDNAIKEEELEADYIKSMNNERIATETDHMVLNTEQDSQEDLRDNRRVFGSERGFTGINEKAWGLFNP